jgi:CubicO group peptidase (beta-lactamase class C family)
MISTSQNINLGYGYLWWLNGKSSYMLPTVQIVFPGSYAPAAPSDMYSGLGKNGQILSIAPSKGLVVVRMGNQASGGEVPNQLCNSIWARLNKAMCSITSVGENNSANARISVFPNPANSVINVGLPQPDQAVLEIRNTVGQVIIREQNKTTIDVSALESGLYFLMIKQGTQTYTEKFIKP